MMLSLGVQRAEAGVTYTTSDYVYPADIGYFNVQSYGATGDGHTDDTQAIQNAMNAGMAAGGDGGRGGTVYFPTGTYIISKSLVWKLNGSWQGYFRFEGQNKSNTIIRLADNAPGFSGLGNCTVAITEKTSNNCPGVIYTANELGTPKVGAGENGFNNDIWNLTVDIGHGNGSAIGIDFAGSNQASIKNVNVISEDGQGKAGISVSRTSSEGDGDGPLLIKNVSVQGFDYGIAAAPDSAEVSVAYEYIDLLHQNVAGVLVANFSNWFREVYSVNTVPAFINTGHGSVTVVDGTFTGGSSSVSAVENQATASAGLMFLRNIVTSGYRSALATGTGNTEVNGTTVAEYAFPAAIGGTMISLNLQNIPNTPELVDNDFSHWVSVASFGPACQPNSNQDAASCIQAALNSGKSTIYFPFGDYLISTTLHVPSSVNRIVGAKSVLSNVGAWDNWMTVPVFSFDGNGTTPVELRNIGLGSNTRGLVYNGSAPLALVDVPMGSVTVSNTTAGTGTIYIEDSPFAHGDFTLASNQSMYIRQDDVETGNGFHSRVNGGHVWVFGMKTEGAGNELWNVSNATFELLGSFGTVACGYSNPCGGSPGNQAFIFNNSQFSISDVAAYSGGWQSILVVNGSTILGEGGWAAGVGVGLYSTLTGTPRQPTPIGNPGPTINSFTANPMTINAGQSATLSWNISGATSISIDQGVGAVSGTSVSVTPAQTTTYTLTATNGNGPSTAFATVTVLPSVTGSFGTKTIDGDASDWSGITATPMTQYNPTLSVTAPTSADLSGSFKAAWDTTNLYLLVQVTDDQIQIDDPVIFNNDGIEILIDANHSGGTSFVRGIDHQIFMSENGVIKDEQGTVIGSSNAVSAIRTVTGGYVIEAAIKWSYLGGSAPQNGQSYGFDIAINDRDNLTRESELMWLYAANYWTNPSSWATLNLSGTAPSLTVNQASPVTTTVTAGGLATLTFNFSGGPTVSAQTVFVHIDDANGTEQVGGDFIPTTPTTSWSGTYSQNQTINIPITVALGTYKVDIGLYNGSSRLTLATGSGVIDQGNSTYQVGTLTVTTPKCDLNADGVTNALDIQLSVNQSLGVASCTGDVNGDGLCNVLDVQRIANAALGGSCITTP